MLFQADNIYGFQGLLASYPVRFRCGNDVLKPKVVYPCSLSTLLCDIYVRELGRKIESCEYVLMYVVVNGEDGIYKSYTYFL